MIHVLQRAGSFKYVLPILVIALVFRLAWAAWAPVNPVLGVDDTGDYDSHARSLAFEGDYGHFGDYGDNKGPSVFRPPGYPFFLAAIYSIHGHDYGWVRIYQAAFGAVSVLLVYLIGRKYFSNAAALAGAAILAVFPESVFYTSILYGEVFFAACLLAAVYFLLSDDGGGALSWRTLAAGGALGLSVLTKPIAVFVLPLAALVYFWPRGKGDNWSHKAIKAAVFTLVGLAVVLPWTVRNYNVSGTVVPVSANSGVNVFTGNHPTAEGIGDLPGADYMRSVGLLDRIPPTSAAEEAARDREYLRIGLENILRNPARFVRLIPDKIGWTMSPLGWRLQSDSNRGRFMLAEFFLLGVIGNAAYVGLLVVAGAGLLRAYAGSREFGAFSVLFLALYLAQIMLAHGDPRYHAPLIPIFAIWAGALFGRLNVHTKLSLPSGRQTSLKLAQMACGFGILFANWPSLTDTGQGVLSDFLGARRLEERQSAAIAWMRKSGGGDSRFIVDGYPRVKDSAPATDLIVRTPPRRSSDTSDKVTLQYFESDAYEAGGWKTLDRVSLERLIASGTKVFSLGFTPFEGSDIPENEYVFLSRELNGPVSIEKASSFRSANWVWTVNDSFETSGFESEAAYSNNIVMHDDGFLRPKSFGKVAEIAYRIEPPDDRIQRFVVMPTVTIKNQEYSMRIWMGGAEDEMTLIYSTDGNHFARTERPVIERRVDGPVWVKIQMDGQGEPRSAWPPLYECFCGIRLDELKVGWT